VAALGFLYRGGEQAQQQGLLLLLWFWFFSFFAKTHFLAVRTVDFYSVKNDDVAYAANSQGFWARYTEMGL